MIYISLFVISFLAATILPLSSELTLLGLLSTGYYSPYILIGLASLGNILGSVFNWFLGAHIFNHVNKKWFFFKKKQITNASKKFNRFGVWSLLFAWVPVIGDPLTLVAGILRINFLLFLILVTIGKITRYLFVYTLITN